MKDSGDATHRRTEYKGCTREFRSDDSSGRECFMCNAAPPQVTGKPISRLSLPDGVQPAPEQLQL
jgi:hypothetical protein